MDDNSTASGVSVVSLNITKPKRILHFSDGILEEYSDEEETDKIVERKEEDQLIESNLTWGPWFKYKTLKTGKQILAACDYAGETFASFLGITSPKYASAINEHQRNFEEKRQIEKEKQENASWQETKELNSNEVITKEMTTISHVNENNNLIVVTEKF